MNQRMTRSALTVILLAAAGCATVTGSWERTATEPPNAPFPVDRVAFDDRNRYTATWTHEGLKRTSTGRYELSGSQLKVLNPNAEPRVYKVRRLSGGRLELTYEENGRKVTAVLERKQP